MRFTPEKITKLDPGEIFVFGSNVQGVHGAGAAKTALYLFGAKAGIGSGLCGRSYAIPTRTMSPSFRIQTLPLSSIKKSVERFLSDAIRLSQNTFLVTKIGCGYAGLSEEEIAPMFKGHPDNVILPKEFHDIINGQSELKL